MGYWNSPEEARAQMAALAELEDSTRERDPVRRGGVAEGRKSRSGACVRPEVGRRAIGNVRTDGKQAAMRMDEVQGVLAGGAVDSCRWRVLSLQEEWTASHVKLELSPATPHPSGLP